MLRYFCKAILAIGLSTFAFADTLNLKDGRAVNGTYLGGNAREIRFDLGDRVETYPIDQVVSIQFRGVRRSKRKRQRNHPGKENASVPRILRPDPSSQSYSRPAVRCGTSGGHSARGAHDRFGRFANQPRGGDVPGQPG